MSGSEDASEIELDPAGLARLRGEDPQLQLIDVREPYEREAGHIAGSRHIELGDLSAQAASVAREHAVVFYCRSGVRSLMAAQAFRAGGFDAYSLQDGLLRWVQEGGALTPTRPRRRALAKPARRCACCPISASRSRRSSCARAAPPARAGSMPTSPRRAWRRSSTCSPPRRSAMPSARDCSRARGRAWWRSRRTSARRRATASLALERLGERIARALAVPRTRRPTRPSAASRERRLQDKRRAGRRKLERRRPGAGGG